MNSQRNKMNGSFPVFDIRDFGAIPADDVINTSAIQQAVAACAVAGGGRVLVAGGVYKSGTIYLKSNVTLRIESGAEIAGSPHLEDYKSGKYPLMWASRLPWAGQDSAGIRALITSDDEENIGIEGSGTISGPGKAFEQNPFGGKPILVNFSHCRNVSLRDVSTRTPSFFTFYLVACWNVRAEGISVESRGVVAGDGMDFDGGKNIFISNCHFNCGDDGISLKGFNPQFPYRNVVISNCIFSSEWAGIRIGPEAACDMREISVSNCIFNDCRDGIKVQNCGETVFENMSFTNLVMGDVCRPIFVTLNSWGASKLEPLRPKTGKLRNIHFSNITAIMRERMASGRGHELNGVIITGLPLHPIESISLRNIHIVMPGEGTSDEAKFIEIPEYLDDQYPEAAWLKRPVPSACVFLRHVVDSIFADIEITLENSDFRPFLLIDDLVRCELRGITGRGSADAPALIKDAGCKETVVDSCRLMGADPLSKVVLPYNDEERAIHEEFRKLSIALEKAKIVEGSLACPEK